MLHLEPFTEADADRLAGWLPTPEALARWTAHSFAFPLTAGQVVRHLRESEAGGERRIFRAVRDVDGEVVGHVEIRALDRASASYRVGRVLVGPAFRGEGVGTAMMRAALAVAFGEMGAHRVELGVFTFNHAAIACYERAGFRREGVRRDAFRFGEAWWSELVMGVLETEWNE